MIPEFPTFQSFALFLLGVLVLAAVLIGISYALEITLGLDLGFLAWSK
jgi:hypothetical protein